MILQLVNIFSLSTAVVSLFVLVMLPAPKKGRNVYLIILLAALISQCLVEFLFHHEVVSITTFSVVATSMVVLLGPTLYFYTRKLYELSTRNYALYVIVTQLGLAFIWLVNFYYPQYISQWHLSAYYASVLVISFIASLSLKRSVFSIKTLKWPDVVGFGFSVLVLLHFIEVVLINIHPNSAVNTALLNTAFQNLFITFFLLIFIKNIIQSPQFFSEISVRIPYKHRKVSYGDNELNLILSFIENEEAYKNPELKCALVAEVTGLSLNQISEIVNNTFKKNFNEWLNDYRINDAKKHLVESDLTVQEIYYKVGFNSKSAFNSAFKRRLNFTPTEFRKEMSSKL